MEKEELCVTRAACIEAADLKKIRFNVKRIFVERRFFFIFSLCSLYAGCVGCEY